MTQFLLVYRRSTGELLDCDDAGPDRAVAAARRTAREVKENGDADVEVVLLGAESREALVHTHARYFKSLSGLAADLAAALPK